MSTPPAATKTASRATTTRARVLLTRFLLLIYADAGMRTARRRVDPAYVSSRRRGRAPGRAKVARSATRQRRGCTGPRAPTRAAGPRSPARDAGRASAAPRRRRRPRAAARPCPHDQQRRRAGVGAAQEGLRRLLAREAR